MSRGVRALIVDLSTRFGGTSARVLGLLSGLPRGLTTLASLSGSPVTEQARAAGLDVRTVGRSKYDARIAGRIASLVRDDGVQVVDAQNPQSKLWASRATAHLETALVSTLNSWYLAEHGRSLKGRFYHALERRTSRRLDLYIAVSQDIRDQLLVSGVAHDQIALVENAISLDVAGIPTDGIGLRQRCGFPPDALVICAVGRLVKVKGLEYLIQSFQQVLPRHPQARCLIMGDGQSHDQLARQIARMNLQHHVRLMGFQQRPDVLTLVRSADIFAMPSLSEGTPLALLEAAALARPIVASHVGGIPSILTDKVDALLVPPADVAALTESLACLLENPTWAAQLGVRARSRVMRDFSPMAQVEATCRAYEQAIGRALVRLGKASSQPSNARQNPRQKRDALDCPAK